MNSLNFHKYFLFTCLTLLSSNAVAQEFKYDNNTSSQYYTVEEGDTLFDIIRYYDLGWDEVMQANPEINDPDVIYTGSDILIPNHLIPDAEKKGIVVNLAELKLYYFTKDYYLRFPISIGEDKKTPTGVTRVVRKTEHPYWIPPESVRKEKPDLPKVIKAGPDNPLGSYALYLDKSSNDKWNGIMIHGTNKPLSVGSRVSHGCMRLYSKDIERLFHEAKIGTPVTIIDQPIKIANIDGEIYIETHFEPKLDYDLRKHQTKNFICSKIDDCEKRINWQKVNYAVEKNFGTPFKVNFPGFEQQYSTILTEPSIQRIK